METRETDEAEEEGSFWKISLMSSSQRVLVLSISLFLTHTHALSLSDSVSVVCCVVVCEPEKKEPRRSCKGGVGVVLMGVKGERVR